ncbi:cobyrinate a,c-diamide synthase [Herpetosiphon sp. NSE202]|uniref:cobyrinate a,c-diamide synthase n=1 Tax=Herpetosiphon sp. NSE202 TaxID=3351349 RepID=UPI00362781B0
MTARVIIAAAHSGSGKTLLTAGLIGALRQRGLSIQPFKCGPDYIDPGHHSLVAQRQCRNLDAWLFSAEQLQRHFCHIAANADLAVIEGVMGLFDGYGALDDTGSTAHIARLLQAPVVLVVDAGGMARSAAALVAGFQHFDPQVQIGAVLLNKVGSARHADLCASAIEQHTGIPCLGYLPRQAQFKLPERHLGLVTADSAKQTILVTLESVATTLSSTCQLDRLLALAHTAPAIELEPLATPTIEYSQRPVIAVAYDAAFSFIYPELHECLQAAGAEVALFSPITDQQLPAGCAGIILSGGYPELYAAELSTNQAMLDALRQAHASNMPIYAECGGLMYLTEAIVDHAGECWPMVGLLPGASSMQQRVSLGYRNVSSCHDNTLFSANNHVRGHEFHYSRWENPEPSKAAYRVIAPDGKAQHHEGYQAGNLLASYIHLHWLANPSMAQRFVETCHAWLEESQFRSGRLDR